MKTALALAALAAAFALVGTVDYQVAAGMAAERAHPLIAAQEAKP